MKKHLQIVSKHEDTDTGYWRGKTVQERFEAYMFLLEQYYAMHPEDPRHLVKVLRILRRKPDGGYEVVREG